MRRDESLTSRIGSGSLSLDIPTGLSHTHSSAVLLDPMELNVLSSGGAINARLSTVRCLPRDVEASAKVGVDGSA